MSTSSDTKLRGTNMQIENPVNSRIDCFDKNSLSLYHHFTSYIAPIVITVFKANIAQLDNIAEAIEHNWMSI